MDPASTEQWVQLIETSGVIGILVTIVVGALREWWVPGRVYKRMEEDRDAWKDYALRSLRATERVASAAEDNLP